MLISTLFPALTPFAAGKTPSTHQALLLGSLDAECNGPHAIYQVEFNEDGIIERERLVNFDEGYFYQGATADFRAILLARDDSETIAISTVDGQRQVIASQNNSFLSEEAVEYLHNTWQTIILEQVTPLSGPREFSPVPGTDFNQIVFSMTGEQDNFVNLYLLDTDREIHQLTQSEGLLEDEFPLSISTQLLNWRPGDYHGQQFVYRTRLRLPNGSEDNQLWLYDLTNFSAIPLPFFEKQPAWSPDGQQLAGVRLDEDNPPLFHIWIEDLAQDSEIDIGPGCNPHWTSDGQWLVYNGHTSSQWQGYTDCFPSGTVLATNLSSNQTLDLSNGLTDFIQIIINLPQ
jgi:hypothetical protein